MDPDKFQQKGHAYKHANLTINARTLHSNYAIELGEADTAKTGRLVVFKLAPKSGTGPRFEGRWDDKQEELDVDVFDATNEEGRRFRAEAEGYSGHHNGKASFEAPGRTYAIKIMWPGIGTIFEGEANFAIHRRLRAGSERMEIR